MNSKVLIVYDYQILFEILNEIKENLSFDVIKSNKDEFNTVKINSKSNYLILASKKQQSLNNYIIIKNLPMKLEKLIEFININFLKNKYSNQSNLKIGKYRLDLNSRKIMFDKKTLSLTERETNLIFFINQKGNVNIKDLQKKVWDYSTELDTHTVETHIYRLRKKMKDIFEDDNFIINSKNGYFIK